MESFFSQKHDKWALIWLLKNVSKMNFAIHRLIHVVKAAKKFCFFLVSYIYSLKKSEGALIWKGERGNGELNYLRGILSN